MRVIRWMCLLLAASVLATGASVAQAQASNASFTVQPGGRAVVKFDAFCVNFGKKFPAAIQAPSSVSPDAVRAVLSYAQSKGYTTDAQKALQVQYAIWQVLKQGGPAGDATTQEVLAQGTAAPAAPQGATSVLDAAAANQVKVTLDSWTPTGNPVSLAPGATDNFYGSGQLTVENTSQQALTLYMPVGTQFGPTAPNEQSLTGYAFNVQVNTPQAAAPSSSGNLPATSGGTWLPALALLLLGASLALRRVRTRA